MSEKIIRGLRCPSCGGSLDISEGSVFAKCQYCESGLLVQGDRGISRFYVPMGQSRESVISKVKNWFGGIDKASDLKQTAQFTEVFPVYIPFWRVNGTVIGWVLGDIQKGSGKNKSYEAVERRVNQKYEFTCPACDIGEFGVKYVDLTGDQILPFDLEKVQAEGMTFGILTTPTDVVKMCDQKFCKWGEDSAGVSRTTFSKMHLIGRSLSIVYYPLWVVRYRYRDRVYQATVDGESGDLLYGRAPGNNLYRVGVFLMCTVVANFIVTSIMRSARNIDGEGLVALFVASVFCVLFGFRKLRYGGEVKKEQSKKKGQDIFSEMFPDTERLSLSNLNSFVGAFKEMAGKQ
jgi:hypothetical protein